MINRIRDLRKAKGWTLADLAAVCNPQTTPQTIGRLETGMRNLTLPWMERIAAALGTDPEALMKSAHNETPKIVARLTSRGTEALAHPANAILATETGGSAPLMVLSVETSIGEYRQGDQLWLRQISPQEAGEAINRDVLIPRKSGRFAFGRLIDRRENFVGVLPPGIGEKQLVIDSPPWLAVAVMLMRGL